MNKHTITTNGKPKNLEKKVVPGATYRLEDLKRARAFWWVTSNWGVRTTVMKAMERGYLKVMITGKGRGKKYHFKGEDVLAFIKMVDAGKAQL